VPPYYEAAAVVGVEVDWASLFREVKSRLCGCPENAGVEIHPDWANCPFCGKPLYDVRHTPIPEWDAADPGRVMLAGFQVVTTAPPDSPGLEKTPLGRLAMRDGVRVFVGVAVARTDMSHLARKAGGDADPAGWAAPDRLEKALAPLGLWDPKRFGVWAVLNRVR
jgi:hypothetical protein